jgi:hypothetical protein
MKDTETAKIKKYLTTGFNKKCELYFLSILMLKFFALYMHIEEILLFDMHIQGGFLELKFFFLTFSQAGKNLHTDLTLI